MSAMPASPGGSAAVSPSTRATQWATQNSGVTARFRGVSAVSEDVAWASGTNGTVVRTIDGGATWENVSIAAAADLDLRDIDAFDAQVAYALSIGSGDTSRIFKTTDGGESWETQFVNPEPQGFFDAMSFWDADRGLAVSDSIDGEFYVIRTEDGGRNWQRIPASAFPPALPGEGYFAASGTNVTTWGTRHAWLGTGAASQARVLRSTDRGRSWEVATTPLPAGPSMGIFSIAFRDANSGVIVGGDYEAEDAAVDNVAITHDGGRTWSLPRGPGLSGYRSAVAFVPESPTHTWMAVGPSGADYSINDGTSWTAGEASGFHAISFAALGTAAWAVGDDGRIERFGPPRPRLRPTNGGAPAEGIAGEVKEGGGRRCFDIVDGFRRRYHPQILPAKVKAIVTRHTSALRTPACASP
jgi:photosystem II stability/assembly factor-like uncharacterized protein